KEVIHIRRLAWLCGELRAGNQFSEAALWRWETEAFNVLRASGELDDLASDRTMVGRLQMDKSKRWVEYAEKLYRGGKLEMTPTHICRFSEPGPEWQKS